MQQDEFPLILSPGLGCPEIISSTERVGTISVIVASMRAYFGRWSLIPSHSNCYDGLPRIELDVKEVQELLKSASPEFSAVDETMENINHELLRVLGEGARIFKVTLAIPELDPRKVLRKTKVGFMPTLFDLSLEDTVTVSKAHAVCLVESKHKDNGLKFIYLTDLHLARRNDLIETEVSSAVGDTDGFNNFNERMRDFIKKANESSDAGDLDFILIGGDLVDFVNHGISDSGMEADNNWQVFIEIVTGGYRELKRGNQGLKVPIFTSTGNHDWRLHPYNLELFVSSSFGLSSSQAKNFDYEYYDTMQALEEKKKCVYEKIVSEGSPISKESLSHTALKWLMGYSSTWLAKILVPLIPSAGVYVFTGTNIWPLISTLLVFTAHYGFNLWLARMVRRLVISSILPIEAGIQALHYYFLHVNPYLNYAFSYGGNYFILMDTGPDCFIGQYLWDEGNKKMRRMSIEDNILGGSPDSMAFYPANEYYSYGQIAWLERVLKVIEKENKPDMRVFICLHAPPINIREAPNITDPNNEILVKEDRHNIRFGTINHFLSQFFHLCLGKKENAPGYSGPKVDIVFSGHAHQKIEFRISDGPCIYYWDYSDKLKDFNFDDKRPFVVQTAACGPLRAGYKNPPYFRTVHVDSHGVIRSFG